MIISVKSEQRKWSDRRVKLVKLMRKMKQSRILLKYNSLLNRQYGQERAGAK